jgi:hypothetical protein
MNSKHLTNKFFISLIIGIFPFLFLCKKTERQKEISQFLENRNITDEEALYGISRIIFGDSLKSFKSEKNSSGKQDVTIEYGGNRAYTFYSEENYSERVQLDTVRFILLYFKSGQKRNLENLRISVVKPYFVKEPDAKKELTEEFEVFRVSISLAGLSNVKDWENEKILNDKKSISNSKVMELFNQVRLNWKIELNELGRVELK